MRRAVTADAVVVLGAGGPALRRRLVHGVGVLRGSGAAYLLLSGGIVGGALSEAAVMRALAIKLGVEAARIIVEDRSRNTFENAVYSGRIIGDRGWRRVIVVTDAYHMPRALYVFRRLGLAAVGAPVGKCAGTSRWRWYASYLRESAALVKSAYLFRIGRHKPVVDAVWRR